MQKRPSRAVAATSDISLSRRITFGVLSISAFLIGAGHAWSESHENIVVSHGYNEYDELKYSPDDPHLEYVNPDAPVGGEISLSVVGTFDSMNAYATLVGSPAVLSTSMYEDMMITTSDEIGSYYCLLCETLEYPESQDWVIFNIRKDVKFSDGVQMTGDDILYAFEKLRTEGTPSYAQYVNAVVESTELLDPYKIKFTFKEGVPRRGLITVMGSLPAFPKHWYEETGAKLDESRLEIGPGTGEYAIARGDIDVGRQLIFRRNPDYWGADHYLRVGHGNYDSIRLEYFGDTVAAFEAFKSGTVTFRQENSSIQWATAYDFPALNKGWAIKDTIPGGTLPAARGFVFNMENEKLQNRSLRLAIGLMFNFTWTNEQLQYGLFRQREAFWDSDLLKAKGLPEGRELELLEPFRDQLPEEIFTEPAVLPHESGSRPLDRRNLRRAIALMEDAGYTPGEDGLLRDADGKVLTLEFIEDTQSMDRIILPYIENLKALGVDVTYNRIDPAQYQDRTQNKDFEMRDAFYRSGFIEGSGVEQKYSCKDRRDVFNPASYCSPVVDALAKSIQEVETYDDMAAHIAAIDRILRYDYFMIPVWTLTDSWVAYYDMYEYPEKLPPYALGHLDFWWINPDKEAALKANGALR